MMHTEVTRRSIRNQGAFFSPYYLFDLLGRQHGDELDPQGRDVNRRLLRRPFRAAWARYADTGSTAGDAWGAWHRELFEALGFRLQRLDAPVDTARQGLVPISHVALPPTSSPLLPMWERGPGGEGDPPLVLVDLHGFGTDLDRDRYPKAGHATPGGHITDEPIARAVEFALDHGETRWAIIAAGDTLRLYRKGGSVARQYLEVRFPALFDGDDLSEWTAFWGLFRYGAFVPDPATGKCLLDRVLEEGQRHASRIADDLRENIVTAVEALIQGILDDRANDAVLGARDGRVVQELFEESLYFLYRLLFILYAESRDLLPVGESLVYRDGYSLEHLRDMAEHALAAEDRNNTYYIETVRALFRMLHDGFPPPGAAVNAGFAIAPFNGQLFDPRRTALLDRCRVPDAAMRRVIRELSLSRPRRRDDRRERYSYADLGVDQLGSIYEGLLVYEPTVLTEETVVARVKGDERLVSRAQADEYGLPYEPDAVLKPGAFALRLWGGRRKGSGSYYTPQEITSFLVKEALEPLVEPIVRACGERDNRNRPKGRPDDILDLKVCDPAMGSGAFLVQACRALAEAYGRARIAAGLDDDGRMSQEEFADYKRLVAERCLYGVDLNPMAVELAKVSLWLETLARGRPLDFLDAHLRCGNSLVGAPLRDGDGVFTVERLLTIPDDALKEVSKEATKAQKADAAARIKRNKEEIKRVRPNRAQDEKGRLRAGQPSLIGEWDVLSLLNIESALNNVLHERGAFERSDLDLTIAEAVALIHEKEAAFERLQTAADSAYHKLKTILDLWCAVWFWPEVGSEIEIERGGAPQALTVPEPPTTQVFLELAGAILGTDVGSLTAKQSDAWLLTAAHVAHQQRFFHWELEFPEVWRERNGAPRKNGGFDAIVGNPPWETVKPNSQEFWSNYDPVFRELGKQTAVRVVAQMRQERVVDEAWQQYQRNVEQTSEFLKVSGLYRYQGRGDINTYKLFAERGCRFLRADGGLGMVLPSGLYTDLGSAQLRELIFATCTVRHFLVFSNERFIFPSVHHSFRYILLTLHRSGRTSAIQALFRLNIRNAVAPEELSGLLAEPETHALLIRLEDIQRFSPAILSLMEFRNQQEVDIIGKMYQKWPLLGQRLEGYWNIEFSREFDMTNDSRLFLDRDWLVSHGYTKDGRRVWRGPDGRTALPLYEGKMIHQYTPDWSSPRWFLEEERAFQTKLKGMAVYQNGVRHYRRPRIAFRGVSNAENERTSIWTFVPGGVVCESLLPVSCSWPRPTVLENLFVVGVGNSFCFDFCLRLKVTNRVNNFYLEQMPMPRLDASDDRCKEVASRVGSLVYSKSDFPDLDVELSGQQRQHDVSQPRDRARVRGEIDALVADLYGLSEKDFAYILTTFPLLDRGQSALPGEPKSFITRDLALLELFKLRGKTPPSDIVAFFAAAGADIAAITGPNRDLAQRVADAMRLGAVAYIPSSRAADTDEGEETSEEEEIEA